MRLRHFAPVMIGLLSVPPAAAQGPDWDAVNIETVHVAAGVYMLRGRGGNIGLSVGEDGAFLVDDQFAPLTEKIQAAVAEVTEQRVHFVLNTHWHADHTGGNENLGKAGALIVAHENVRKRINPAEFPEVMGRTNQLPPDAWPVVTFNDAVTFYWNSEKIHAFHASAAHTDGDAVVHFTGANVVHMGDLFFNGTYPFIDVAAGGGIAGVIAAADRVLQLSNSQTKIIPGHGALSNPAELRAYRDMLVTVRDRVRRLIAEGKSEDAVVAAKPTEDLNESWGSDEARVERFVRAVYQGVANR